MEAIPRVLVRGVNWLGDAVMTTPALLRLREVLPSAHITLLTPAKLAGLWQQHPAINDFITFAAGESAWCVGRRLRAYDFQLGLVFPNSPRSALELWLARIPQRIGFARPWRNWWLTHLVQPPHFTPMRRRSVREIRRLIRSAPLPSTAASLPVKVHHIYHYLPLAAAAGASIEPLPPKLVVTEDEVADVSQRFGFNQETTFPLLGLNAGAEYGPAKRWPAERFISAAIAIQKQIPCCWLILGGPSDLELGASITAQIQQAFSNPQEKNQSTGRRRAINLAGATSLRELCAAIRACRLLLTNDTGPMHVAAALGTPVVVPFGSTSPELTGPGLPGDSNHHCLRSTPPCAPCFRRTCPIDFRCMLAITTEQVVSVALAVLRQ